MKRRYALLCMYSLVCVCTGISILCSVSCSKKSSGKTKQAVYRTGAIDTYADAAFLSAESAGGENRSAIDTGIPVSGRKLIKTGSVRFSADDIQDIRGKIETLVTTQQGYIADENGHNTENRIFYDMTVKIPSNSFDVFLHTLEETVTKYESKSVHIEDVSEEFIDSEARVRVKKQTEARYAQLLSAAKDMKDILAIQKEMDSLRADIEALEGRLHYLSHEVQFSTLHISMHQDSQQIHNVFFDAKRFSEAFISGISLLFELLLELISIWPFVIFCTIAGIIGVKKYRRKKRTQPPKLHSGTSETEQTDCVR